jgi:DNA-binding response OmpR family regulator
MTTKKKILVIEDELALLKILCDQLTERGYEVSQAMDGKEGLEKAKSINPDLIMLDIKMPVMDGMTMLNLLRKEKGGDKIKIIILTNIEPDAGIIEDVINDRPFYYFLKSDTKLQNLFAKVEKLLEE